MSYNKREQSRIIDKLKFRLQAAKEVDSEFDFGNGISAVALEGLLASLDERIDQYNQTLSDADDLLASIRTAEKEAKDASDRLLRLMGGFYGPDSLEYQRLGGTRKSQIDYSGSRQETFDGDKTPPGDDTPDGSDIPDESETP
jgi:hypothetical protein